MSLRGLEEKHEHGAREMARDTRPLGERVSEFFSNPLYVACMLGTAAGTIIAVPATADLMGFFGLCIFLFAYTRKVTLPFKMPLISKLPDYNDTIPGTNKPKKGQGIAFFGNEKNTQKELWFSNDDMRTHVLIFGSTGSGKTEALVSIAFNSLAQGSGFIYIDGKGDNSLYAKVFGMVRRMGRDDDMLLINFMTGARDVIGAQKSRLSNTMNPFANGSSSMLSQLVVSLMDSGGGGGDGDMWKGRAISFVEALMKILVGMRDEGHILLDANLIRSYFILEKLEQIVVDRRFPLNERESVPLDALPQAFLDPLDNYIYNLPGYNKAKKGNQAGEVREQHGFITMQLGRVFSSLADTYSHIVRTNLAEVDLKDVVLNRRILVVLLPALEKSPEELANLGKIIIASLKAMMAAGLGDEVEGDYRDVILRKPTNSPTPYVCIMDEYGYYAVPGFAVVPAQARSLGFSAIFAGQDLPAFQKASKEEAASIGANTNIKICMKMEDPTDTWEFFNKTAGETYATSVSGFQVNAGSMTNNYADTRNASIEKRSRIDLLDLRDQREGDAHIFWRSKIIRARMFYANPKPAKKMQVNQYLCVEKPSESTMINLDKRIRRFAQVFSAPQFVMEPPAANEDINIVSQAMMMYATLKPFERSIAAVIAILEKEVDKQRKVREEIEAEQSQEFSNEVHAFTPVHVPDFAVEIIGEEDLKRFSNPLLLRGRTREALTHIERLSGQSEQDAAKTADNIINDIIKATYYPPKDVLHKDVEGVLDALEQLYEMFNQQMIGGGTKAKEE
ncbi:MAG: phosphoesterase [Gammaproteobacteria bacterium 39-13]|nr:TraM recognition domain-containing protein [Gammaproteobacteria bacterium]OJV85297.1 MAG: phosphoesterase [Gammaproteobacteria bacterium 39-13]